MVTTKERFERAATENQFMNGKIRAIEVRDEKDSLFRFHILTQVVSSLYFCTRCTEVI